MKSISDDTKVLPRKYPNEFLGRCQTCLDNAMLSREPCSPGYGNGQPLSARDCLIYCAREQYDREQATGATR